MYKYLNTSSELLDNKRVLCLIKIFASAQMVDSAFNAGDPGLITGSGRSLEEGNVNPFQYSCLKNPIDRGAWRVTLRKESGTTE